MSTTAISVPASRGPVEVRVVQTTWVRDIIREDIRCGRFDAGALPGEQDLMREYGATRSVVRAALQMLREERLIERRQGTGTHVIARQAMHPLDTLDADIGRHFQQRRVVTGSARITELASAPRAVVEGLALDAGSRIRRVDLEMYIDGQVFQLASSYLPETVAGGLRARRFQGDYYQFLEDGGVVLGGAQIVFEAVNADAPTAARLDLEAGRAVMMFRRITRNPTGAPVEIGFGRLRSDRVALVATQPRQRGVA